MPINNIQYRAEIGIFNIRSMCSSRKSPTLDSLLAFLSNTISKELKEMYGLCLLHLISLVLFLIYSPFILLYTIIFSDLTNLCRYCVKSYIYVNIFMRFILNLLYTTIAYRQALVRFSNFYLVRYTLFFQVFTLLPFVSLLLIMSGDIESNPGPDNVRKQNISLCHWNLNGI